MSNCGGVIHENWGIPIWFVDSERVCRFDLSRVPKSSMIQQKKWPTESISCKTNGNKKDKIGNLCLESSLFHSDGICVASTICVGATLGFFGNNNRVKSQSCNREAIFLGRRMKGVAQALNKMTVGKIGCLEGCPQECCFFFASLCPCVVLLRLGHVFKSTKVSIG